eukprot:SAG11_NODE_31609_length_290_cov_1.151832_1_plen_84_part_01
MECTGSGPTHPTLAWQVEALLAYYEEHEPRFATPRQAERICRVFQRKAAAAATAATAAAPDGAEEAAWIRMMYAALAAKAGEGP